ncbi:hypothetical protein QUA45_05220 [Microcoleus sp. Pol12A5]
MVVWKPGTRNYIISGYTGMMLTVDCQPSTVNRQLEFTIPMLTDLILSDFRF